MVVLINGAFGVGKTTVARLLVERLPQSLLFDPEVIGFVLRPLARFVPFEGRGTDDYQDLLRWRSLTIRLASACLHWRPTLVVPMAFTNTGYLEEIRSALRARDPLVLHFCLTAPLEVVHARLARRGIVAGAARGSWAHRRAAECCAAHVDPIFAEHVATEERTAEEVAEEILRSIAARTGRVVRA